MDTLAGIVLGALLLIVGAAMIALSGWQGWIFGSLFAFMGLACLRAELLSWRRSRKP